MTCPLCSEDHATETLGTPPGGIKLMVCPAMPEDQWDFVTEGTLTDESFSWDKGTAVVSPGTTAAQAREILKKDCRRVDGAVTPDFNDPRTCAACGRRDCRPGPCGWNAERAERAK